MFQELRHSNRQPAKALGRKVFHGFIQNHRYVGADQGKTPGLGIGLRVSKTQLHLSFAIAMEKFLFVPQGGVKSLYTLHVSRGIQNSFQLDSHILLREDCGVSVCELRNYCKIFAQRTSRPDL